MICCLKLLLVKRHVNCTDFLHPPCPCGHHCCVRLPFISISLFLFFRTRFIVNSISSSSVLFLLNLSLITLLALSRIYSSGNAFPASSKLFFTLLNTSWTRRGLSDLRNSVIDLSYPSLCLHLIITPLPLHFCRT